MFQSLHALGDLVRHQRTQMHAKLGHRHTGVAACELLDELAARIATITDKVPADARPTRSGIMDYGDRAIALMQATQRTMDELAKLLGEGGAAVYQHSSGHETTTSQLMDRPDHAVVVAHDDEPWNLVVQRIADHTTALIAAAGPEQLGAALQPWSQIEEFAGQVTAGELAEVMALLQPLFRQAAHHGRHIYISGGPNPTVSLPPHLTRSSRRRPFARGGPSDGRLASRLMAGLSAARNRLAAAASR